MSVELKPCPFCGGEARTAVKSYGDTHYWRIYCDTIDCAFGASGVFRTEAEAIEAWNSRTELTCENIDNDEDSYFRCSVCNISTLTEFMSGGYGLPTYCPNCGAKVVGE